MYLLVCSLKELQQLYFLSHTYKRSVRVRYSQVVSMWNVLSAVSKTFVHSVQGADKTLLWPEEKAIYPPVPNNPFPAKCVAGRKFL